MLVLYIRNGQYAIWTRIKAAQRFLNRFQECVLTEISRSNDIDVRIYHNVQSDYRNITIRN